MPRILITGGTGTFGNAITPTLLAQGNIVTIFSRDEQKQELMRQKLGGLAKGDDLRFFLGDVRDQQRLAQAMYRQDIIIHAAALKIVPKGEFDPSEFKKTNIDGTDNVAHAALDAGVGKAIMLSTDKAVAPINLYGATKLTAEKLFTAANNYRSLYGTIFSVVRYGNVANSRGSVIEFWRRVAAQSLPLPLTHPEMTRFWITIEDAAEFVLSALIHMTGGEVFIPRMPSFRLRDLAEAIAPNLPTKTIGIRPGEKIHEDIITVHEAPQVHADEHAYVIVPSGTKPSIPAPLASLTSANNSEWLTTESLIERLKNA